MFDFKEIGIAITFNYFKLCFLNSFINIHGNREVIFIGRTKVHEQIEVSIQRLIVKLWSN